FHLLHILHLSFALGLGRFDLSTALKVYSSRTNRLPISQEWNSLYRYRIGCARSD
ncbi:hypothetical protein WG66_010045, partial [Moniliophthora roreri]